MFGSWQGTEKVVEHKGDGDANYRGSPLNSPQKPGKEVENSGDQSEPSRPQHC